MPNNDDQNVLMVPLDMFEFKIGDKPAVRICGTRHGPDGFQVKLPDGSWVDAVTGTLKRVVPS